MRDFDTWFNTMTKTIIQYNYFVDFDKIFDNINSIKIELNILNSLIGSKEIKDEFKEIINKYPEVLKCIPILIAVRNTDIIINHRNTIIEYNFNNHDNIDIERVIKFMENTGLFYLLENKIINNLIDYVTGVEVGLDSNARKNRTGIIMEKHVEYYLKEYGFKENINYFKQFSTNKIKEKYGIDIKLNNKKQNSEKKFDFVIEQNNNIYGIEVNYYNSQGSKLNETARSYIQIYNDTKNIDNFTFIWITDGLGWIHSKNNLKDAFTEIKHLYNLNDLAHNTLKTVIV